MTEEGLVEVRTEITQVFLGLDPYVLVEGAGYDEAADQVKLDVKFGGGVASLAEAREMLQLAVDGITEQLGDVWPPPDDEDG